MFASFFSYQTIEYPKFNSIGKICKKPDAVVSFEFEDIVG